MQSVLDDQTYLPPRSNEGSNVSEKDTYIQLLALVQSNLESERQHSVKLLISGESIDLPPQVIEILVQVARAMNEGKAISVVPHNLQVSTQEAADILGISRPTLVRMCESGVIPYNKINRHRRLYLANVVEYRERQRRVAAEALNEMVADSEMFGDYDDDPAEIEAALQAARQGQ